MPLVKADVTMDWDTSPRIFEITNLAISTVTVQELINVAADIQDDLANGDDENITDPTGKEDLGGGGQRGLFLPMNNCQIKFGDRVSFTRCVIKEGTIKVFSKADASGAKTLLDTTKQATNVYVEIDNEIGNTIASTSGTVLTVADVKQMRHRLGMDGDKTTPAASVEAFVNLAKAGDAMALTTAERAALSDFLMQRDAANYEDGADKVSLAGVVLKLMSKFTLDQIADLARIFKTDGTPFATQALAKDTSLLPTKTLEKAT